MPVLKLATGLGMMTLTIIIHALFMVSGAKMVEWHRARFGLVKKEMTRAIILSAVTVWMFLAVVLEALIWALLYLFDPLVTALPDLETAFYFSMVTFTTLGYGYVVPTGKWRTLAFIQAANGVIIFGWTTALIFYYIKQIYEEK